MRIGYCTNVRLPSERAHGHQIAQVCDALVHLGHEVQVYAPYRNNIIKEDYWTYYGAERGVQLTHLGSFDAIASPFLPGVAGLWTMNWLLRKALAKECANGSFDLLYTRAPALLPPMLASNVPTVLELHQLPRRNRSQFVSHCNRCALVACLTSAMRDALVEWGVDPDRVAVEGDAVDLRRFENLPSKEQARQKFGIETDRLVVGYIGRLKTLGMEKGVGVMLEALGALKDQRKFFGLVVGGPEGDQREYEGKGLGLGLGTEDLLCTGEVPASDVPAALAACDVLAMPFPDFEHYRKHMSPLKMFEYMAAGKPIITSDLPTVRDVLSEETAVFCEPGSTDSLANAMRWIAEHPEEAQQKAEKAYTLVCERYTWEKRMERILTNVSS